jgi:hypothetical protein
MKNTRKAKPNASKWIAAILGITIVCGATGHALAARLVDENFEAPGYEESWTEVQDTSCTIVDNASIPGGVPPGAGSYCVENYVLNATANQAYATQTKTGQNVSYVRGYLYVDHEGMNNGQSFLTLGLYDAAQTGAARVQVGQDAGVLKVRFGYYNSGDVWDDLVGMQTGRWYRIEYKYDRTNNQWAYKLYNDNNTLLRNSGGPLSGFTRTPTTFVCGILNHTGPSSTKIYTDLLAWDTLDWVGEEGFTISGSVGTLDGVTMNGLPDSPVTSGGGFYSGTVNRGWLGTVTPLKTGYRFDPTHRGYFNVVSDQVDKDYTPTVIHAISGSVGTVDGVTMNGLPGSPVTSGGGFYSATVDDGWSGTVIPTKVGYTFDPENKVYASVTSDQTNEDFTPVVTTYAISGSVGTLDGVTMSGLPGDPVTSGGGFYSADVGHGWLGTVIPTKTGYRFDPVNQVYADVTSDQANQDYTPTVIHAISGSVGTIDGVTMSGLPGNPVTSGGGFYSVNVDDGWSGMVTPAKVGYTFGPENRVYANVNSDQVNQDYTPTLNTYTISGSVGTVNGVTMNGLPGSPVTSGNGFYSATVDHGWSGTVTPTKVGYTFDPEDKAYTDVASDQVNQDYAPVVTTYGISGSVTTTNYWPPGSPNSVSIDGVTLSGLPGNPVINGGFYFVNVDHGWSGTVTPIKAGYAFSPVDRAYSNVMSDQINQDFYAPPSFTISGSVGMAGVTMSGLPGNPVTSGGGFYSVIVPNNWDGTVTPTKAGYRFSPASRVYNNLREDQENHDYTPIVIHTASGSVGTLDGVTMSGLPGNPVTSGGGFYSVTVDDGASGTVTPVKAGYTFEPANRVYANITSDQVNQDYVPSVITYTISGNVGTIDDVIMSGLPGNPLTTGGSYSATVDHGWSGTVTPTKTGYTFTPENRVYTNITSNQVNQDYSPPVTTYSISGTVYTDEEFTNIGIDKTVRLKVNGAGDYTNETDSNGAYSITGVTAGSGDVITVFLDEETEKGVTVTRFITRDLTDLHLYQNRLIVRHEDAGPITNSDLAQYDKDDDADIHFTSNSGTLTVDNDHELHVWTGSSFSPGEAVTTLPGGASPGGDIHIESGATLGLDPSDVDYWTQATASAGWSRRTGHTCVVYDDKMWVMGGQYWNFAFYVYYNDVWHSTDGMNWTQATSAAPWSGRSGHASVVYDDKMWVLGGDDKNDVWYSADGINWTEATPAAAWEGRSLHTAVVYDNKMWVIGGGPSLNDVWYSADGISWTQATSAAPWSGRNGHSSVVYDGKMWVIGGYDGSGSPPDYGRLNDVWYSSDGTHWTQATSAANWEGRTSHASVVFDDKMWVLGGFPPGGYTNDIWYSVDGANWTEATSAANWSQRYDHTPVVYDGVMWVMGGYSNSGNEKNDAWFCGGGNITVGGNWSNSGTFIHKNGTVTFNGTAAQQVTTGGSDWHNLSIANTATEGVGVTFTDGFTCATFTNTTAGSSLYFRSGQTVTITGDSGLTLTGASGQLITLVRDGGVDPAQWNIDPSGGSWSVSYVYVEDSNNLRATYIDPSYSQDGGNNTDWFTQLAYPLASFVVDSQESASTGTAFTVTIYAKDSEGNTTTDVTGDTTLSVDAGTISPTSIAEADFTDDGIWTGNVTLSQAGARTITATNDDKTGQNIITINAGSSPLASFSVDAPDSGTAGTAFSVTIIAEASGGNTTTNVSGDTTLSVDAGTIAPTSIPEADFTDDGIWTGNVTLSEAGARTITATNNGKTGQDNITINGGALASFIVDAPDSETAGAAFSVTIYAKDSEGNTTTDVSGNTTLSADAGTISPTSIPGADFTDDGIWTGNVTLCTPVGLRTMAASNLGNTGQDDITINTGPLDSFIVDAPDIGTTGTPFSVTITAKDCGDNTITDFSEDTTLSVDAGTIDPTSIPEANFTDGIWTGDVTLPQEGSRIITATSNGETGQDTITIGYRLTMAVIGGGSTTPAPGDSAYVSGTVVNISAIAAGACWEFDDWSGDVADVADPEAESTTVTMNDGNKTVTANFTWVEACEFHNAEECSVCHVMGDPSDNLSGIREEIDLTRLVPPKTGSPSVTYPTGGDSDYVNGDPDYDGICEACHTETRFHQNNASGDHDHQAAVDCTLCHSHCDEFAYAEGHKIHTIHFDSVGEPTFPPNETGCKECHADGTEQCVGYTLMWDDKPFEDTQVCGLCHNPPAP